MVMVYSNLLELLGALSNYISAHDSSPSNTHFFLQVLYMKYTCRKLCSTMIVTGAVMMHTPLAEILAVMRHVQLIETIAVMKGVDSSSVRYPP